MQTTNFANNTRWLHRVAACAYALPLWLVLALCMVSSAGCRGCIRQEDERLSPEELQKRAREQKEAIVTTQLLSMPADSEIKTVLAKPGHWVETSRRIRSNREDLQVIATGNVTRGAEDVVLRIPGTNLDTEFARPTILPKGQWKAIDLQYFVPTTTISVDPLKPTSTGLRLRSSLVQRSLLTPILQEPFPANELRFSEFILAVVSPKPQEYSFLTSTDLALWRTNDMMQDDVPRSYYVVQCGSNEGKLPFPTSLMTMTAMAVVVWDDLAPDDLSEEQKSALVDWLHWGGQLIVSGPGSWSRLQNSFLMPYLPVRSVEPTELGTDEFQPLNYWVVPDTSGGRMDPLVIDGAKVPGLAMTLATDSQWLPETGNLVAERMVGRGRVVFTSFPLREQRLYRWKYFPSFLSSGILRRPARKIKKASTDQSVTQLWDGRYEGQERNPLFNTQLRIAARDMPLISQNSEAREFATHGQTELARRQTARNPLSDQSPESERPAVLSRYERDENEALQWSPNGAAWSDTSGFAFSALSVLRSAAGIVLPDRWTILMLISGYLAILVPINWLVFRLIGRLEFAWVAAPIIAIAGVLVVTRVARLDIGFARRTTEVGLLELQGEYPRGHLTNYAAFYTSLSTNYAIDYPESGSVALPLGDVATRPRRAGNASQTIQVKYGSNPGIRLDPVTVYSNSTEMLHAEQMVSFPGGILYGVQDEAAGEAAIKNQTGLKLKSCCAIRKTNAGRFQVAWIGDLLDDSSRSVTFLDAAASEPFTYWNRSKVTRYNSKRPTDGANPAANPAADAKAETADAQAPADRSGTDAIEPDMNAEPDSENNTETNSGADASQLAVGDILHELLGSIPLAKGQVRLFGYTDDRPGKMESPQADGRLDSRTVVMAHLRPANLGAVAHDTEIFGRVTAISEPPSSNVNETPPADSFPNEPNR